MSDGPEQGASWLKCALPRSGSSTIHAPARTLEYKVLDFARRDILSDDAVAASTHVINVSMTSNERFIRGRCDHGTGLHNAC
jgi:hypothetical protein